MALAINAAVRHWRRQLSNWWSDRKLRGWLRAAPAWSLAELPEDTWARITGTVRPYDQRVLEAPLSGRLCVYYSILVEELRGNALVVPLAEEQEAIAFVLESGDRRAVIDANHAKISVRVDHFSRSKAAFDATPRQRGLLERHSLIERDWFMTDSLRYCEAVIRVDESIAVLGSGTREPDPAARPTGAYRDGGPTRLRLTGSAKYPLVICDDPKAR